MQTVAEVVADVEPTSRRHVTRVVHEAVLTMRFQMARERPRPGRAAWPDYVYERDDHGDRPAIEELRALVLPFQPTSRHFDLCDWVYCDVYGKWPNPRSGRNGLERWQWLLLELRAWQTISGLRGGWRSIAEAIRSRPGLPKFSHEWARIEHERLIDVAVALARKEGRV